jgi:hypothetical protein
MRLHNHTTEGSSQLWCKGSLELRDDANLRGISLNLEYSVQYHSARGTHQSRAHKSRQV